MKKILPVVAAVLLVCSTGCDTLEELLDSISAELDSSAGSSSSSEGGTRLGAPQVIGKKNYALPKAYDTAYSFRTDKAEQSMRNIPKNIEANRSTNPSEYVRQIAEYITGGSKTDFERIKKAHDLVALLIKYDAASFWANTIPDQSYANVLKTRTAVCEGYSNLFKKLCDELKIPCDIVHGYARGVGTSPLANDTPTDSNHAWNIVTIEDESYLIDCTWDSGYMDGKVAKQRYTTNWLFLKPEHFLYTHYPENPKQQLLATPLTAAQFSALPFFEPKFFEVADDFSIRFQKINPVDNTLSFDYTTKDGYWINFTIHDIKSGKAIQNRDFTQTDGTKATTYFSFPAAGQYSIRIFWWKSGAKQGEGCGEFVVEASSASAVQYPTTYSSSAKNLKIISPVEMPLKKGEKCEFKVRVDNKKIVAVIYGKTFIPLTKGEDNIFSGECEIPGNISSLSLGIADSERGRYENIAQYQVK
jgi:hypothetical protein